MAGILSILAARERIAAHIHVTPIKRLSSGLLIKNEIEQVTGSFKIRGAANALLQIQEPVVGTVSSGNHGAALAFMARKLGKICYVFMPSDSPKYKVQRVREFGGRPILREPTEGWQGNALSSLKEMGARFVHPYDDSMVISGQGTLGLEILLQQPNVTSIYIPLSGGGLLSGVALAVKKLRPEIRVYGVEPEQAAKSRRSLALKRRVYQKRRNTIADALRAPALGKIPFSILTRYVDGIIAVTEEEIVCAMEILYRHGEVVEPAGAAAVAASLFRPSFSGRIPLAITTGGSIDPTRHQDLVRGFVF